MNCTRRYKLDLISKISFHLNTRAQSLGFSYDLYMTENEQIQRAIDFVKNNKSIFIDHVVSQFRGTIPENPLAVFMAGTPGAGKTEVAKNLIAMFDHIPVRIDADEFRELVPGYNGTNSEIVQSAASLAVDKVMDAVIAKNMPFILDATFAVGKAKVNIKRAYRHEYETQICFVYQDPLEAWNFTKKREEKEGRRVPKEAFISAYFLSRQNVKAVKKEFGDNVVLRVIIKNYLTEKHETHNNVQDIDEILPKMYTESELKDMLYD